jgi:outer membrane receptor for ferrienterochelin and colicin
VDWIRTDPAATRWQAENIGDVTTQGAEIAWQFQNSDPLQTRLRYQWLDKDADTPPYASRYFLDYARHLLTAQIDWTISDRLRFEWIQSFREQAPHPLREAGGDQQWNTTLALHTRLLRWPELQWSLMATNALQDDYRPFPGQNTYSPRRVSLAVTRSW